MANIKKSFNFRSGIQVDDDNFIVNSNGLVGIGSTIPTEILDVTGNVNIRGTLTANVINFSDQKLNINTINVGVTSITSGIISAASETGIVTYYGDGSKLQGLPTSQWVDVDPSLNGYESIYAVGNVGIATTNPSFTFQVGGDPILNSTGIGINSSGNVYSVGIITALSFAGLGSSLTQLNASNISSGTISTDRFPQDIAIGGIITATTFVGNLVGISSTAIDLTSDANITIKSVNTDFASIGTATINNNLLVSQNSYFTGLTTVNNNLTVNGDISFTGNIIGDLGITTLARLGIATNTISNNSYEFFVGGDPLFRPGVAITAGGGIIASGKISANELSITEQIDASDITITNIYATGIITASSGFIGNLTGTATTATNLSGGNVDASYINVSGTVNSISGFVGNLTGTATTATNVVGGISDVTLLSVSGISSFQDELIPYSDQSGSIGTVGKSFGQAFISDLQFGVSDSNIINTRTGDLILDSQTGTVIINQDFEVNGNAAFNNFDFSNILVIDSLNERVGIGSTIPSQTLSVVGNSKITGALTVGENDFIILDGLSDTVTIKNLIVTGSTTGVTAVGSGITISTIDASNSGTIDLLVFNTDFLLSPINSGITTISLSPNIGIGTDVTIGIGTDQVDTNFKLHIQGDTYISNVLVVDDYIISDGGFSSGIGTPIEIDGFVDTGFGGSFVLSAVGVGTLSIPFPQLPNDVIELGVWNSTEYGYSTLSNVGIGTTNPTSALTVSGDTSITGVTTSVGGFTSGIGVTDPVQIIVSGNVLTFIVAGVGSTSLTLY